MDDDPTNANASATGIADCLRILAEEAASLRLVRTVMALLETVEICRLEARVTFPTVPARAASRDAIAPTSLIVH